MAYNLFKSYIQNASSQVKSKLTQFTYNNNNKFNARTYTTINNNTNNSTHNQHTSSKFKFNSNYYQYYKSRFTNSNGYRKFSDYARRFGYAYGDWLERYPFTVQIVQSGFLGGAGDATTQYFEHQWDLEAGIKPRDWDLRRSFACTFFGIYFMGPLGHIWYIKLEQFCNRFCKSKVSMITTKVCADTFVFGPFCLWAFFTSVSVMEGTNWDRIMMKLKRDFVPTYIVDYSIWPVVQAINFRYIPVQHQLLVVNLMCYFDDIFLSYVQHNSLPRIFQLIEDWWANLIKAYGWDNDLWLLAKEEQEEEDERRQLFQLERMKNQLQFLQDTSNTIIATTQHSFK